MFKFKRFYVASLMFAVAVFLCTVGIAVVGSDDSLWVEAETGWLGRQFLFGSAGSREYIYTPAGLDYKYGGINYDFNVTAEGYYELHGVVWAADAGSDSFLITVCKLTGDGKALAYNFGIDYGQITEAHWRFEPLFTGYIWGTWKEIPVNHVNIYLTGGCQQMIVPIVYYLSEGHYIVKVKMREDGAKLDKLGFVKATGTGGKGVLVPVEGEFPPESK